MTNRIQTFYIRKLYFCYQTTNSLCKLVYTDQPHGGPADDLRHVGDLGNVAADASGRASFRLVDRVLNVGDIIGRSLVIKEGADDLGRGGTPESKTDGAAGKGIACGIIARSAGLFDNPKKICACDGKTLWDERGDYTRGKKQSA